jgi:hypothetical protein
LLINVEVSGRRRKMGKVKLSSLVVVLLSMMLIAGASACTKDDKQTLSVAELMADPEYDTRVTLEGTVGLLGELFCPCFELTSGGETVMVWYGLMVEDDGTEKPTVSVEGIENGDQVIVTGELKRQGIHHSLNDFWASNIEKG